MKNTTKEWKTKAAGALNRLHAAMKRGHSEGVAALMAGMARLSHYSIRNQFLIMLQVDGASNVKGYKEWRKFGRHVRKGEKGIRILAPIMYKKNKGTEEETEHIGFRSVAVFDVTQTDGPPLETIDRDVTGDIGGLLDALEYVIMDEGINVLYAPSRHGESGASYGGRITIDEALAPASRFSVLAHEFAHEIMHQGEARKLLTKRQAETEAESVAAVICGAVGLESGNTHVDYIHLYNADVKLFESCLTRIQITVKRILAGLEKAEGRGAV